MKLFLTVERKGTSYTLFRSHETSDKLVKGKRGRSYTVGGILPSGEDCGSRKVTGQWSETLKRYSTVETLTVLEASDYEAYLKAEKAYVAEKFGRVTERACKWRDKDQTIGCICLTIIPKTDDSKAKKPAKVLSEKAEAERLKRVEAHLAGKSIHSDPVLDKDRAKDDRIVARIRQERTGYHKRIG